MNSKHLLLVLAAALSFSDCESSFDVTIPSFPDGGLVRTGRPLSRDQLMLFEGMFDTKAGSKVFGNTMAVRTSPGTVSLLTDHHAAFAVTTTACLPDRRVVIEGYWRYPTETDIGLVRLFVEPPEVAGELCDDMVPTATTALKLVGNYGYNSDFPTNTFSLSWSRELIPWRGRFFTTAHHGACENTDHCGTAPNTLESIRLAERIGSNAAEVDVRMTRDGFPILFHDPGMSKSLVRGTFCNGQVPELSLAEIRGACEARYGETIPTLEEALDMMVNETELEAAYLDMKVPDAVLPAARLVANLNAELEERNTNADMSDNRTFVAVVAITTDEVRDAWHAAKKTLTDEGLAVPPCLLEYDPDLVIEEGCVAWGPTWTKGPQPENVAKVRAAGARTVFWTINQSEFIDEFLKTSHPDGIITARAALLFHHYQTLGEPPPVLVRPTP
ncbi:MAG TPA: glycerophosphodiester phosphodiesterase [Polyangiaceae bacterium]